MQYIINDETKLHLLRHFNSVPASYLKSLAAGAEQYVNMTGSKFHLSFADTPDDLWQKIEKKNNRKADCTI